MGCREAGAGQGIRLGVLPDRCRLGAAPLQHVRGHVAHGANGIRILGPECV